MKKFGFFLLGALVAVGGVALAQSFSLFSGIRLTTDGTLMAPVYSWNSDRDMGIWRGGTDDLVLSVDGGSLSSGYLELTPTDLFASAETMFFSSENNGDVTFQLGDDGGVPSFNIEGGDASVSFGLFDGSQFNSNFNQSVGGISFSTEDLVGETLVSLELNSLDGEATITSPDTIVDGDLTITGSCTGCVASYPLLGPEGSSSAPSYSFTDHPMAGLYWNAGFNDRLTLGDFDGVGDIGLVQVGTDTVLMMVQDASLDTGSIQITPTQIQVGIGPFAGSVLRINDDSSIETLSVSAETFGYRGLPQESQSGNYTIQLGFEGWHIYHPSGAGAGDTFTIEGNGGSPFPVGSVITIVNSDPNDLTIASGDTIVLAGSTDTTPCDLSENGMATALKVTSTSWVLNGAGLTCTP